jgi:hypothetical protein
MSAVNLKSAEQATQAEASDVQAVTDEVQAEPANDERGE